MSNKTDKPLLLEAGTPPKPVYGTGLSVELIRFWWHMKILKRANSHFFNGIPDKTEDWP